MADIPANLQVTRERIEAAAKRSGRPASDVDLVVVTKTWPPDVVEEVIGAGHRILGENKLQEAAGKIPQCSAGVDWHFIGHLQRNKARKALELFETIHSVDSLRLAGTLNRVAGELGVRPSVYLQVNIGGEDSKSGFSPEELRLAIAEFSGFGDLKVEGLMCLPPVASTPDDVRPWFQAMRTLRDELQQASGLSLPGLSMGMSHDYEVAIEEGATVVRVGSAIFGPRKPRDR